MKLPFYREHRMPAVLAMAAMMVALTLSAWAQAAEQEPLAIKGYDPVAYFTVGKPQSGRQELEYLWDEQRYRFVSERHRALFAADPARYAPQFSSYCAMSLARGEWVEANPEYWLIDGGKLYLFGKPTGPALFRENLAANTARANGNRALTRRK